MYLSIYENNKKVQSLVTIDKLLTKGLIYEVLYVTEDKEGNIFYEMECNDNQYYSINSKYFYNI